MARTAATLVTLPPDAPDKPALGSPCNGCGVCCAAELCPLGRVIFRKSRGPCPALTWRTAEQRHDCGLVVAPKKHLPRLPRRLEPLFVRLARRWIAAGIGCDSDVIAEPLPANPAAAAENSPRDAEANQGESNT